MKILFYKALLKWGDDLSPNERILYSFLVSKSIMILEDVYEKDGKHLDNCLLFQLIEDNDYYIPLCKISNIKMAKELGMTRQTIINSLKKLKNLGYIKYINGKIYIFANESLLRSGYFELKKIANLCGELLIFYSFLCEKSSRYGGCIDTYKNVLANEYGKTIVSITKLLNRLYANKLAKRLKNNKLLIKLK